MSGRVREGRAARSERAGVGGMTRDLATASERQNKIYLR